jgi:DNA-binding NarL/FixJ family response regulator
METQTRASLPAVDALTERQRQVLALMARGYSNGGIAQELVLTEKTVENHVGRIYEALGIAPARATNPRVQAVLAFLAGTHRGEHYGPPEH